MALVVIPAEGVVLCSRHDLNITQIQNLRFIWVSALRFHGDSVFIWKINKSSPMSVPGWWFRQERLCKTSAFKLLGRVDQSRKKSATIYLYLCKIVLVHVHAYTYSIYSWVAGQWALLLEICSKRSFETDMGWIFPITKLPSRFLYLQSMNSIVVLDSSLPFVKLLQLWFRTWPIAHF